jgi:hypothetical protein
MPSMTIGRLAKEAGVNIDTIHADLERCPIVAALSGGDSQ